MCGCETYIIIKQFQLTFNSWEKRQIKQYRCGVALYFLSYVSAKYNIVDRMIGTLDHEMTL